MGWVFLSASIALGQLGPGGEAPLPAGDLGAAYGLVSTTEDSLVKALSTQCLDPDVQAGVISLAQAAIAQLKAFNKQYLQIHTKPGEIGVSDISIGHLEYLLSQLIWKQPCQPAAPKLTPTETNPLAIPKCWTQEADDALVALIATDEKALAVEQGKLSDLQKKEADLIQKLNPEIDPQTHRPKHMTTAADMKAAQEAEEHGDEWRAELEKVQDEIKLEEFRVEALVDKLKVERDALVELRKRKCSSSTPCQSPLKVRPVVVGKGEDAGRVIWEDELGHQYTVIYRSDGTADGFPGTPPPQPTESDIGKWQTPPDVQGQLKAATHDLEELEKALADPDAAMSLMDQHCAVPVPVREPETTPPPPPSPPPQIKTETPRTEIPKTELHKSELHKSESRRPRKEVHRETRTVRQIRHGRRYEVDHETRIVRHERHRQHYETEGPEQPEGVPPGIINGLGFGIGVGLGHFGRHGGGGEGEGEGEGGR